MGVLTHVLIEWVGLTGLSGGTTLCSLVLPDGLVLESKVAAVDARRSSANEHVDRTEKVTRMSGKTWGVSRWSNQSSLKSCLERQDSEQSKLLPMQSYSPYPHDWEVEQTESVLRPLELYFLN